MTQATKRLTALLLLLMRPKSMRPRAFTYLALSWLALTLGGCAKGTATSAPAGTGPDERRAQASEQAEYSATLVVAGGCFWCVESDLEKLAGVGDVVAGYAGGTTQNPTYRNHADHLEVVRAPYDPQQISYAEIIEYFLRHIDPLDAGGQFCDRGHSYTTAVFFETDSERTTAEAALARAESELGQSVVTPALKLDRFWVAEDYHQNYYKENPIRYKYYRNGCGRDARVAQVWGNAHK